MTLTLEIAPEVEKALATKARGAGVPLNAYAARVLERDVTEADSANGMAQLVSEEKNATFLALAKELMPIIEAGTVAQIGSVDPTAQLDELRDERDDELQGAIRRAA